MSFLRSFFAVLTLLFILPVIHVSFTFSLEAILITFTSALLGPLAGAILYIKTIKLMGSGNAVTISYLYIFFAQLTSYVMLREKPAPTLYIGSLIALLGVYIVYRGESRVMSRSGIFYGLAAAILWGVASTILKIAANYGDPACIALIRNLFALLVLLPFAYGEARIVIRDKGVLLAAIISGSLGLGIGMWLFIYAMNMVGVSVTVLVTSLTPILTRILSVYIAGEKPTRKAYLGTVVTSTGILLGVYKWY